MLLFGTAIIKVRGDKNMKDIELKLNVEPKDNYEKARKLLWETDNALRKLTPQEQQKLAYEFSNYKILMQKYFG